MARKDDITGKKTVAGRSRRHQRGKAGGVSGPWSKKAPVSNRTFRPNLTRVRVLVDGVPRKLRLSMKTYKRLRNYGPIGNVKLDNRRSA